MVDPMGFTRAFPPARRPETAEERTARIAREAEIIAKARADLDAGLGIDDDDLEAWLDDLDHDPDMEIPTPAVPRPR